MFKTSPKTLALIVISAFALVAHGTAYAAWKRVETIKIDGNASMIPAGGTAIHRDYPAGVYRFSIDPKSPGISYFSGKFPPTKSAFIMILDNDINAGKFYSKGLSADEGPTSVTHASDVGIGVEYFIEDWYGDNSGSVNILVDKWK